MSDTESIEIVSLYSADCSDFDMKEQKAAKTPIGGLIGLRYSKKGPASAFSGLSSRGNVYHPLTAKFPEVLSGQTLDGLPMMEKTSSFASITSICTLDYERARLSGQSPESLLFWPTNINKSENYDSDQYEDDCFSGLDPLNLSSAWASADAVMNTPKPAKKEIPIPEDYKEPKEPSIQELLQFILSSCEESVQYLVFEKLGFKRGLQASTLKPNVLRFMGYLVLSGLGGIILYKARYHRFKAVQRF